MHVRSLRGWWVPLCALVGVGAIGSDSRLADAIQKRDVNVARALLKQNVDVNAPRADGTTALHWAVYHDDLETANLLLEARAQVNVADQDGVTPLWLACVNGN